MADPQPSDLEFAEAYVEKLLSRVWETKHWGVGDVLLRECPREHLQNVAFIFLGHLYADKSLGLEEFH